MSNLKAQELVRELITETDHLSREWHGADHHTRSGRLEALRSTLQRIERSLGGADTPRSATMGELDVVYQRLRDLASGMGEEPGREALNRVMAHADHLRHEAPALLGPSLRHPAHAVRAAYATSSDAGKVRSVALVAGAAVCLLVPASVPVLRRSPFAWGIASAFALIGLAAALPARSREALVLAGRDAAARVTGPLEGFA